LSGIAVDETGRPLAGLCIGAIGSGFTGGCDRCQGPLQIGGLPGRCARTRS
jgi:hypothetical protein